MNRLFQLIIFSIFLLNIKMAHAQAYDGRGDDKIFLGYANVKNYSAVQFKLEGGNSNLISVGINLAYFLNLNSYQSKDILERFFDNSEVGFFMNFHLNKPFNLNDKSDLYIGPYLSLNSTGIQAGYKYNFSERFGLYGEISKGFYNVFNIITESSSDYEKRTMISVGLTYNILRYANQGLKSK